MPAKLRRTDVVVIGLGWSGAILANELTDEGLDVVALERGPWRDTARDLSINFVPDELRYGIRLDLVLRPAQQTFTVRNNAGQTALPIAPARWRRSSGTWAQTRLLRGRGRVIGRWCPTSPRIRSAAQSWAPIRRAAW
jgi:choline dehydrogenase-like flavoprotein